MEDAAPAEQRGAVMDRRRRTAPAPPTPHRHPTAAPPAHRRVPPPLLVQNHKKSLPEIRETLLSETLLGKAFSQFYRLILQAKPGFIVLLSIWTD